MITTIYEQSYSIVFGIVAGIILCYLISIYKSFIEVLQISNMYKKSIIEASLTLISSVCIYLFLLKTSGGNVNFYVYIYIFSGYYIFKLLIYKRIFDINIYIIKNVINCIIIFSNGLRYFFHKLIS